MKLVINSNSLLQKITSFTLIFFIALTMIPAWGFSTYAEEAAQAGETKNTEEWDIGFVWKDDSAEISLDTENKYSEKNSIKIENTEFNNAYVERTFSVKPNTLYKFSAMVKYSGYSMNPDEKSGASGANIGIAHSYDRSEYVTDSEWTRLEYVFDSEERTEVSLSLSNGMYGASCMGTAWFSDVKLEENTTEKTNEWNVLVVIFKDIKLPSAKGRTLSTDTYSFNDDDIEHLKAQLKKLYKTFDSISDGQMKVGSITVAVPEATLTSLKSSDTYGYKIDPYALQVSNVLDHYLAKKTYNQIIAISPIKEFSTGWIGLGGTQYKGINFCQTCYKPGDTLGYHSTLPELLYVHEMLHGMESNSRAIAPEKTAVLHDNKVYGYEHTENDLLEWYIDYMRSNLPDGKGLDPSVFQVYAEYNYIPVSDDMTVSDKISA